MRGREGGREEGEGREEGSRESGMIIVSGRDLVADKLCLLSNKLCLLGIQFQKSYPNNSLHILKMLLPETLVIHLCDMQV